MAALWHVHHLTTAFPSGIHLVTYAIEAIPNRLDRRVEGLKPDNEMLEYRTTVFVTRIAETRGVRIKLAQIGDTFSDLIEF